MLLAQKAVFLDFDHTLFNTDEFFHVDVRNAFRGFGVDDVIWEDALFAVLPTGYNLEKHIEEVKRRSGKALPVRDMKSMLTKNFYDLRKYLFLDVKQFLKKAKKDAKLYLLSFGDHDWQQYKVRGSGINDFFDDIFFTAKEGTKADVIVEMVEKFAQTIIIDNNPAELDIIKEATPDAQTFCINRVPDGMRVPKYELARLKFLEARKYLDKPQRYAHISCRTLAEIIVKF